MMNSQQAIFYGIGVVVSIFWSFLLLVMLYHAIVDSHWFYKLQFRLKKKIKVKYRYMGRFGDVKNGEWKDGLLYRDKNFASGWAVIDGNSTISAEYLEITDLRGNKIQCDT